MYAILILRRTDPKALSYSFVAEGAPYYGYNESDTSLRYFNGTPAAVALWGLTDLDGSVKSYFNGEKPQLIVSGPNEGVFFGSFTIPYLSNHCLIGTRLTWSYIFYRQ